MNQYVFDPVKPVVETRYGKLRGITYGDISFFMGIRYAKAKRFQMPEDPEMPEMPDDPEMPEMPEMPDVPEMLASPISNDV